MHQNIFFGVPLTFLLAHEEIVRRYPVNAEVFADGDDLERLTGAQAARARELLDARGVRRRVHGPISEMAPGAFDPRVREAARTRIIESIDFAGRLGAEAVVIHSGFDVLNKKYLEERYLGNMAPILRALSGHAAVSGVRLLLENTFEPGPELLLEAVSRAGAENIRLCFDIAHHTVFGRTPLEEWVARCAPLIEEVHITDTRPDWDYHLSPGRGCIDFDAFFSLLRRHGVRPCFTFEPHDEASFVECLAFIEKRQEYFS